MLDDRFVFLGVLLTFIGHIDYIIATIKGKTKPNRISWFFWTLSPLIAFFAEIQEGVGLQAWMTFSVGFGPLLVFIASFFNKKSYWKLNKMDYVYGALALIGIILWQITGEGYIAIVFSILSDGLATIPTAIKSYSHPESESSLVYLLGMCNAIITLLTINTFDFAHLAFPVYFLINVTILFTLVQFKIGSKVSKK